jgi:hypothetical protein
MTNLEDLLSFMVIITVSVTVFAVIAAALQAVHLW